MMRRWRALLLFCLCALPLVLLPDEITVAPALEASAGLYRGEWVMTTTECPMTLGLVAPGLTAIVEYTDGPWFDVVDIAEYDDHLSWEAALMIEEITFTLGSWNWVHNRGGNAIPGSYSHTHLDSSIEFEIVSSTYITGSAVTFLWDCTIDFTLEAAG